MTDFEAVDDALLDVVATINRKLPDEAPRINQESRRQFQSAERALDKLSKNDDLREIAKALESTNRTLADVLEDWGISDRHISEGFEFIEERQLEREAKKLQDREDIERSDVDLVDRTMSDVESEQLRDGLVVLFDHADRVVQAGSKNAPGDRATQRLVLMVAALGILVLTFGKAGIGAAGVKGIHEVLGNDTTLQEAWGNWQREVDDRDF